MTRVRFHRKECSECYKYYQGIMPYDHAIDEYLDTQGLCPSGEEIRFKESVLTKLSTLQDGGCVTQVLILVLIIVILVRSF